MNNGARRLAALFVIGLLAFLSPLVGFFNRPVSPRGLPLFPSYIYLCWAALIFCAWLLARKGSR